MRTHIHGSWSAIEVLRIQWPARELWVVPGATYWSVPLSETDTWPPLRVIAHVNDDSLIIPATDGRHRRLRNCWAQCIGEIWHIIWKRLVPRTTHPGYELWTAKNNNICESDEIHWCNSVKHTSDVTTASVYPISRATIRIREASIGWITIKVQKCGQIKWNTPQNIKFGMKLSPRVWGIHVRNLRTQHFLLTKIFTFNRSIFVEGTCTLYRYTSTGNCALVFQNIYDMIKFSVSVLSLEANNKFWMKIYTSEFH